MAESDTILQLGIEAAREGNREEARSLFGLLTRQEPDNVQAWLWLAGVAEGPDERRAALERVIELDPNNEMARKGLQALGVDPNKVSAAPAPAATVDLDDTDMEPVVPVNVAPATPLSDEERYAAELDSAFDDYDTVEKEGGAPRNVATSYADEEAADEAAAGIGGSARDRVASRRSAARSRSRFDGDDDTYAAAPPRRGMSTLALGLIAGLVLIVLIFFLFQFFANRGNGTAETPTTLAAATSTAAAGGVLPDATSPTTDTTGVGGDATVVPGDVVPTSEVTGTVEATPVPAEATPVPAGNFPDPASANPAQVGVGTPLEVNGWTYNYPSANYAVRLGNQLGDQTAQNGQFAVVLVYLANNTGAEQTIPADFFVLKDAQGRVFTTNAAASAAYTQPGINADISLQNALPSNGVTYSVALVFDIAPDSTGLVLFTRPKQDQGYLVLP